MPVNVDYITHSGNDMLVVNAARASFGKFTSLDTPLTAADINLIRFLARGLRGEEFDNLLSAVVACNTKEEAKSLLIGYKRLPTHWAPFAHPHITLREQMPLFVARQRYKHAIGMVYSEESRRYIDNDPEMFLFDEVRERPEGSIKQGSGDTHLESSTLRVEISVTNEQSLDEYKRLLARGVAPEQARSVLNQNMMITSVVTGALYAFANSYNQRSDGHAQKEIQDLAAMWHKVIEPLFPVSWKYLTEK